MWRAVQLLAAATLVVSQPIPPNNPNPPVTTVPIRDVNAAIGGGAYAYMKPQGNSAGELPRYAELVLFPPQRWGRTTCTVDDANPPFAAGRQNCDSVLIDLVSTATSPPNAPNDEKTWAPFNQYPRTPWENMNFRFAGFDSADMFQWTAQVTSSPPCLFTAVVLKGGRSLLLVVQDCALPRQVDLVIGGNAVPGTGTQVPWQSMFDVITIFVPHAFLAVNPTYGHVVIQTQATYFLANEVPDANGDPQALVTVGPYPANTPYYVETIPLRLNTLELLDFYPGNVAQGIKANTAAGAVIDTMTVGVFLGRQLQAGMKLVISLSVGPVDIFGPDTGGINGNRAPPAAFPTQASGGQGLVWAVPSTVPANTFIALGPGCGRAGSVHCCSASIGEVLVPQVSVVMYPEWITTLAITLGPAGCVLPSNRRFIFQIPKAYLGKNPSQTVTDAVANQMPNFWAMNIFMYTTAEPQLHFVRKHLGDISPLAYQQGYFISSTGVEDNTINQVDTRVYNQDMPDQLPDAVRMHQHDLIFGGGLSSYIVGSSAFRSITFKIDSTSMLTQPTKLEVTITLNKGLPRLLNAQGVRLTTTPYVIAMYFTTAIIRPNSGTLVNPIRLTALAPVQCDGALNALTTATGNLMIWFDADTCVTQLVNDGSVLTFNIPESLLYRIAAANWAVSVDAHLVPPMNSVGSAAQFGAVFAGLDTAAVINVPVFTTTLDCSTLPINFGTVNDIYALSVESRCVLADTIIRTSVIGAGFVQCQPGANVNNANSLVTYVKFPEADLNGVNYPGIFQAPPVSSWPQNVALPGTPAVYVTNYGIMWTELMLAVIVSYPPTVQNLKSLGGNPAVPSTYSLAFIVRISRITTACSVVTEPNPWAFCVALPRPVVNPLFFPAANPVAAGVVLDTMTWGRLNGMSVACFLTTGDGAVVAYYPLPVSPGVEDESDGAWYAFFAFFALPLCLLCCCLLALLYFLKKRKPKTCCPGEMGGVPVQEMYWVNAPAEGQMYMQPPFLPATPAGAPVYMVQ